MKRNQKSQGQTLIEFALLLPLFLLLIMALFDIGRAVLYYGVLNTAVREGTRFAIVQRADDYYKEETCTLGKDDCRLNCDNGNSFAIQRICQEITQKHFGISELSSSTIWITRDTDAEIIRIEIEFPFNPITPGLNLIDSFVLRVNSQMLIAPIAQ